MMTTRSAGAITSTASELRTTIQLARNAARPDAPITAAAPSAIVASGRGRQMLDWLEDASLLLVLALAFPLLVLIMGAPVALIVRLLIEIVRRWL